MSARKDPLYYFRAEARELVDTLSRELVALGRGDGDTGSVAALFRYAHTLKGAANVVGEDRAAGLARMLEDVLALHREEGTEVEPGEVPELLRLVEALEREVERVEGLARGTGRDAGAAEAEHALETVRLDLAELDALTQPLATAVSLATRLAASLGELDLLGQSLAERAKLDRTARPIAGQLARVRHSMRAELDALLTDLSRARDKADHLRLVPSDTISPMLERGARMAAQSLGKAVRFELVGGEVRVDRRVLPGVREALLHLVRNAVDHGVEDAAGRREARKADEGTVRVTVERVGNRVAFACEDDGSGIDPEEVGRAAVERGLATPEEVAALDAPALLRLLFREGMSTRREVTELSGRGVGLDVVGSTAARLQGVASIRSELGRGTRVELVVPVSLSTVRAIEATDLGTSAFVPLDAVEAVLALEERDLVANGQRQELAFEGGMLPLVRLGGVLEHRPRGEPQKPRSVLVTRHDAGRVALGIEAVVGVREVVLHPLPWAAGAPEVVLGAALDLEGAPRLMLDPRALARAAEQLSAAPATRGDEGAAAQKKRRILVVDDSLTTRMLEQTILEMAGYEVDLATSGEEGLGMAGARPYDLFVVDVEMPGMSGFEFAATTRADARLRATPVVLVTSLSSDADRARGREAGAAAYVVKGQFHQATFLKTVADLSRPR